MRHAVLFILIFFQLQSLPAQQLYITPGAQLTLTGDALLTLDNMHFINNGSFEAGSSLFIFKGSQSHSINGTGPVVFYDLGLNKASGQQVSLSCDITVTRYLEFSNGMLHIGNRFLDLGATGILLGEHESSRVTGSGGQVRAGRTLNAPVNANIGNLGAIISSTQDLGMVRISRGHEGQFVTAGINVPVYRYYQIVPTNNTALNAGLQFRYFDAELNGNTESILSLYQQTAPSAWANRGFSARDATTNTITQTGLDSLGRFTISSAAGGALPVQFTLFNFRCDNGRVVLTWHTAAEENSLRFIIQRSPDGIQWTEAGSVPAAGNSITERTYTFTDNNPLSTNYYRLAEYDINGRVQYSSVLRASCSSADRFLVWPNPAHRDVYVSLKSNRSGTAVIRVYDSKGALVKEKRAAVLPGSNQVTIEMSALPTGMYSIVTEDNETRNTTKIYKQ